MGIKNFLNENGVLHHRELNCVIWKYFIRYFVLTFKCLNVYTSDTQIVGNS